MVALRVKHKWQGEITRAGEGIKGSTSVTYDRELRRRECLSARQAKAHDK
ncbi:alcohol dehydrogenase [Sesbania bispinosa]|nr:alcohol dehydrogenase [Sesbania bispinosa]KAJ1428111.1 alcohol dehydrogenase [Sesbania bispinosa]